VNTKQDTNLSSFRPFLELVSILLFLLGPEMLKNADSPRLERGKSPLELRTLLKSQPDNLGKHSKYQLCNLEPEAP